MLCRLEGVSEGCLYLEARVGCDCLYDSLVGLLKIRKDILFFLFSPLVLL